MDDLYTNIKHAQARIRTHIQSTPLSPALFLSNKIDQKVYLKLESLNNAGSFKIRGATNALMQKSKEELARGVVAASAGNHAQGVASTCRMLGTQCNIFMPESTPLIKCEATRELGATLHLVGDTIDDALHEAENFQKLHGGEFVHAFANEDVIAGQGTIGLELLDQLDEFSSVFVPIGGGGLISGIACAVKKKRPNVKVIGVQTSSYPSIKMALEGKDCSVLKSMPTIADGIAIKKPSELTLKYIRKYVDDILVVSEDEIAAAVMLLLERGRILVEGAGAASVAGLLNAVENSSKSYISGNTICVISGGNIDVNLLNRIMKRGIIYSGRQMKVRIEVKDRPGYLASVLNELGSVHANVIDIHHIRTHSSASQFAFVKIDIDLETVDKSHQEEIASRLDKMAVHYEVLLPTDAKAYF